MTELAIADHAAIESLEIPIETANQPIPGSQEITDFLYSLPIYERVAWCIEEYLSILAKTERENDALIKELSHFENILKDASIEKVDLVRACCEAKGSPIDFIKQERFQGFLLGLLRGKLATKPRSIESFKYILDVLGFPQVTQGTENVLLGIKEAYIEILRPPATLTVLYGAGSRAFIQTEKLFKYVLSFYGQWIGTQIPSTPGDSKTPIEKLISHELFKDHRRIWKKWHTTDWVPDLSDAISIIDHWNELVSSDSYFSSRFQSVFQNRQQVIDYTQLNEVKNLIQYRHMYAHDKLANVAVDQFHQLTTDVVSKLLEFGNYLQNSVIPPVVNIQNSSMGRDRITRLKCLHENGEIVSYSFRQSIQYDPEIEYFFYFSEERKQNKQFKVEVNAPILLPVDFRIGEGVT